MNIPIRRLTRSTTLMSLVKSRSSLILRYLTSELSIKLVGQYGNVLGVAKSQTISLITMNTRILVDLQRQYLV